MVTLVQALVLLASVGSGAPMANAADGVATLHDFYVTCVGGDPDPRVSIVCGRRTIEVGVLWLAHVQAAAVADRVPRAEYAGTQEGLGERAFEAGDFGAAFDHFTAAHDAYAEALGIEHEATARARRRTNATAKRLAR